ncbi:MAG: amidophosphoribosyltransferase [Kiritimatiellia bacterium]|jgi:amidophosphoribosyltransferase
MGGFFGVVTKENCASSLFYGTDYHSHLGTVRGGLALWDGNEFHRAIHDITNTPFRTRFETDYDHFRELKARSGIGVISDLDDQPLLFLSHHGTYALVTVGLIKNIDSIVKNLLAKHQGQFSAMQSGAVTQTEVVGTLINTQDTIEDGLRYVQEVVQGSCSILLLKENDVLYAARDRYGRTPIAVGRGPDCFSAATESCALPNLGFEPLRELGPGEIVRITATGMETLVEPSGPMRLCAFLYVYYGYPASSYQGQNVEQVRYRCGEHLAKSSPADGDIVAGIPDSGVAHALGFAQASGIRYERPFVKYTPTWPRSFLPSNPTDRHMIAEMKLIPIPSIIQGRRIVFCDDSVVRGTQLRNQAKRMRALKASEVHIRIACPPLLYPCEFIGFSRSRNIMDLISRRVIRDLEGDQAPVHRYRDPDSERYKTMIERIRDYLRIDSLAFQRVEDIKKAIGFEDVCTYCWTGEDPAAIDPCSKGCESCEKTCLFRRN